MKLSELITSEVMQEQNIIANKRYVGSFMIYSKKIQTWIWCDKNGKALEYEGNLIRVNLTKEIIEDDNWYIFNYPQKVLYNIIDEISRGESLKKISDTLEKVGVHIQNSDGSFRSVYDIISDLSKAYETMVEVENEFKKVETVLDKNYKKGNKLIDLLDVAMETGDIIINTNYTLGIKFLEEEQVFVWCNVLNQQPTRVPLYIDSLGCKRVILSKKILQSNEWFLTPKN